MIQEYVIWKTVLYVPVLSMLSMSHSIRMASGHYGVPGISAKAKMSELVSPRLRSIHKKYTAALI